MPCKQLLVVFQATVCGYELWGNEFDEKLRRVAVRKVKVMVDGRMLFEFKDGKEFKA